MNQIHRKQSIDGSVIDDADANFVARFHRVSTSGAIAVVSMVPASCSSIKMSSLSKPFLTIISRAVFKPSKKIDVISSPDLVVAFLALTLLKERASAKNQATSSLKVRQFRFR